MNHIERARQMRPIVEKAVQAIDGSEALEIAPLYPEWAENTAYTVGFKVQRGGRLWRCIQAHTSLPGWEPENASGLWEQINETHSGTEADPIPYSGNMALTTGLCYMQDWVVYRCIRDTGIPVHNRLEELVGLYVELVE